MTNHNEVSETAKDGAYRFHTSTLMRHVRLAMVLAMTTAASLGSVVGVSSASAVQSTAAQAGAGLLRILAPQWPQGSGELVSLLLDE
jgi:hypothetical protein